MQEVIGNNIIWENEFSSSFFMETPLVSAANTTIFWPG